MTALTVNRAAFERLPADLREIVRRAAGDEALRMLAEMTTGNGAALAVLIEKHGVELRRFPPEVYRALMATAAEVVADTAAKDPFTMRVYQNWSAFRHKQMALAPLTELGYMTIRAAS